MMILMRERLEKEDRARIVAWMRWAQEDRGLSQRELGKALGVDESHISKIYRGHRDPGLRIFYVLHRKFHVELNRLVYGYPDGGTTKVAARS